MPTTEPVSRPVEAVEPFTSPRYCSCGLALVADDAVDLAVQWYGHLTDAVRHDPDGSHELEPF